MVSDHDIEQIVRSVTRSFSQDRLEALIVRLREVWTEREGIKWDRNPIKECAYMPFSDYSICAKGWWKASQVAAYGELQKEPGDKPCSECLRKVNGF